VNEESGVRESKKEAIKIMIRRLHEGADPEKTKKEFKDIIAVTTPAEIAKIEEELINEGMPRQEVQRLCEVHLAVFRESLEESREPTPPGHPIYILMEEHKMLLKVADELRTVAGALTKAGDVASVGEEMRQLSLITEHFKESEKHYLREENVLFPHLEKHGITQPPAIMWSEHDKIRGIKKNLYSHIESRQQHDFNAFVAKLAEISLPLHDMLSSHFYKENNILFPTALSVVGKDEWKDIRKQFDEIGYCCFTPQSATVTFEEGEVVAPRQEPEGVITLETGAMSKDELEATLNTLPVDITFVDKDDTVRYFSQSKDRIFVRTKAVIGRKVQQCHPQKSVHEVNRILETLKKGERDVANFWIDLKGRLVYIRYFAVRDKYGHYLGCVEVTQDITDLKKIQGEKRLLDWT